ETQRLHPLVPAVSRRLVRPLQVLGFTVPAGIGVAAGVALAHQREEGFPEPERLLPDRFLGRTYSPDDSRPFGGGARRCLGAAFALYEMKIVLATLLTAFEVRLQSQRPARTSARAATVGPDDGIPVVVERRRA